MNDPTEMRIEEHDFIEGDLEIALPVAGWNNGRARLAEAGLDRFREWLDTANQGQSRRHKPGANSILVDALKLETRRR